MPSVRGLHLPFLFFCLFLSNSTHAQDGTREFVLLRAGLMGSNRHAVSTSEVIVKGMPFARNLGSKQGLFFGGRYGGDQTDFSSFTRFGGMLGYDLRYTLEKPFQLIHFGVSTEANVDYWDVSENEGEMIRQGITVASNVAPYLRLWRFDVSLQWELGYSNAIKQSYRAFALHIGIALF